MNSKIYIDLAKYPFLADLDIFMKERLGIGTESLGILLDPTLPYIDIAVKRFKEIMKLGEKAIHQMKLLSAEEEVFSFYILLLILSTLNNKRVTERVITAFAKRFSKFLENEHGKTLEAIAESLNINLKYLGPCGKELTAAITVNGVEIHICYDYAVHVIDYIKIVSKRLSQSISWKLTNQIVYKGWVYLDRHKTIRFLEEAIALKIYSSIKPIEPIPELTDLINDLRKYVGLTTPYVSKRIELKHEKISIELPKEIINVNAFPPCIRNIYELLTSGSNLSHQQRFAIATFLINIGMDLDEILELFKHTPDFNEKVARYQIEHLAGLRGSKKKYLPYSCETMKSLGMCVSECNVKNPLIAYLKNIRKSKAGGEKSENNAKE